MKIRRLMAIALCAVAATGISMAQGLSEAFKGNDEMTRLFVSPLGIDNVTGLDDAKPVEAIAKKKGLKCEVSNWGEIGQMAKISSPGIAIGGVKIADLYILTGKNAGSIVYKSEPSDKYIDMVSNLDKSLAGFQKFSENDADSSANFNMYMVDSNYGIAVCSVDSKKTAFAYLIDIKDLQGFMKMGMTLMNTVSDKQ